MACFNKTFICFNTSLEYVDVSKKCISFEFAYSISDRFFINQPMMDVKRGLGNSVGDVTGLQFEQKLPWKMFSRLSDTFQSLLKIPLNFVVC